MILNFSAMAQDEDEEYDILEINLITGIDSPSGDFKEWSDTLGAKGRYLLGADIGFYLNPKLVLGAGFIYHSYSVDNSPTNMAADGLTHRLYSPSVFVKFMPSIESNFVPYLKGFVGMDFAKLTTFVNNSQGDRYRSVSYDAAMAYGMGAGLFYYTSDYSGLFLEMMYHISATSDSEADYQGQTYKIVSDLKQLEIRVGVKILFGSDE